MNMPFRDGGYFRAEFLYILTHTLMSKKVSLDSYNIKEEKARFPSDCNWCYFGGGGDDFEGTCCPQALTLKGWKVVPRREG